MKTEKRPKYDNIFEYLDEHYVFKAPETELTTFYKKDIAENQYKNLTGPVKPDRRAFKCPDDAAALVIEFAKAAGADLVGFSAVLKHFVFEGIEIQNNYAVVLGFEMDYDLIATAPELPSGIEVLRAYWRLGSITVKVAEFIRDLGYSARAHHPRGFSGTPPTILHSVSALEAGLGEFGRHGLLITPEFGPRVRLATITTDLELPAGERKSFGVEEYCRTCSICRDACEGDAIPDEKAEVRGFLKYTIDPYKCLPYFAKYDGCNLCVARCPFNKRAVELSKFIDKLK